MTDVSLLIFQVEVQKRRTQIIGAKAEFNWSRRRQSASNPSWDVGTNLFRWDHRGTKIRGLWPKSVG